MSGKFHIHQLQSDNVSTEGGVGPQGLLRPAVWVGRTQMADSLQERNQGAAVELIGGRLFSLFLLHGIDGFPLSVVYHSLWK